MSDKRNALIERCIAEGGGSQAELARRCGCPQQRISKVLNFEAPLTPTLAIAISRATDGKVKLADLLPDLVEAVAAELGIKPVTDRANDQVAA